MHYHFEGKLTTRDCKRYIQHRFFVPEGCVALDIDFGFAPHDVGGMKNLLTLTLPRQSASAIPRKAISSPPPS